MRLRRPARRGRPAPSVSCPRRARRESPCWPGPPSHRPVPQQAVVCVIAATRGVQGQLGQRHRGQPIVTDAARELERLGGLRRGAAHWPAARSARASRGNANSTRPTAPLSRDWASSVVKLRRKTHRRPDGTPQCPCWSAGRSRPDPGPHQARPARTAPRWADHHAAAHEIRRADRRSTVRADHRRFPRTAHWGQGRSVPGVNEC